MLTVVDKKGRVLGLLGADDGRAMLAAFAQSGASAEARERGADVVRAAQQRECWFRCDCLGPTEPAPVLVPVAETHIRRSPNHPDHAEGCPFEMTVAERESYAASLREPAAGDSFQLARAISRKREAFAAGQPGRALARDAGAGGGEGIAGDSEDGQGIVRGVHNAGRERSKLSQLLFKLLSDTKLHQVGRGPRGHADQQAALYKAARGISLGGDLMLSGALYTDAGQLDDLIGRVRLRARWPVGRRPHGVLAFVAERIEDDVVVAVSGTRLTVTGPIAVFGPGKGRVRIGPFVVAVLVASPDGRAPLAPLKAYAHPCWSASDMLPVDSSNERRSLDILVRFRDWMGTHGYSVEITKPLHDRSRYFLGGEEPDQVVKPDFEGKVFAPDGRFARSLVVETLGFRHAAYRAKKQRLKEILTRKPGRYLEHLAHDGIDPAEGDRRFCKDLLVFGKSVIDTASRKPTPGTTPATVPLPPTALPVPPPVPPRPPPPALAPPRLAVSPAPAAVPQILSGSPVLWPAAASAVPVAAASRPPEPGGTLGWLTHRVLAALRGKR